MATFDNLDAVAVAGRILERLGDKSLELSPESRAKILQDLNDALNVLNETPSEASQAASFAPENNDENVSPSSSFTPSISQDAPSSKPSQTAVSDDNNVFSNELLQHIDDVRSGRIEPKAISNNLKSDVERHEINRCRGDLANEGLWNGSMGWRSAADFYAAISYIWVNARDVFTKFDDFREIVEDKDKWDQTYFETQRNYLRHNFSLERLCHLVMVYDYLHGREARVAPTPVTRPKITVVPENDSPFGKDSARSNNTSSTSLQSRKNWIYFCIGGVVIVVIALAVSIFLLRDKLLLNSETANNGQQQPKQTQESPASATSQERMPIGGRPQGKSKISPRQPETGSEKK